MNNIQTHLNAIQLNDESIDIGKVISSLGRHKFLIGGICLAATLLTGAYTYTRQPIWEGNFCKLEDER